MKKTLSVFVLVALALSACNLNAPIGSSNATVTPTRLVAVLATQTAVAASPTPRIITATPTVTPTAVPPAGNSGGSIETFTYTPGGESFGQVGYDVTNPEGQTGCFRVWQATNLKNTAWTAIFCNWKASSPAPKQQWPHPMQLTISGTGTVEFDLYRDLTASKDVSPDPYVVANAQKSPLGLGWFTQGYNGSTCVDGKCQDLSGGGVFQMNFPKDWTGHYHIVITVNNGQVQFWQGERVTSTDNWPTP